MNLDTKYSQIKQFSWFVLFNLNDTTFFLCGQVADILICNDVDFKQPKSLAFSVQLSKNQESNVFYYH